MEWPRVPWYIFVGSGVFLIIGVGLLLFGYAPAPVFTSSGYQRASCRYTRYLIQPSPVAGQPPFFQAVVGAPEFPGLEEPYEAAKASSLLEAEHIFPLNTSVALWCFKHGQHLDFSGFVQLSANCFIADWIFLGLGVILFLCWAVPRFMRL